MPFSLALESNAQVRVKGAIASKILKSRVPIQGTTFRELCTQVLVRITQENFVSTDRWRSDTCQGRGKSLNKSGLEWACFHIIRLHISRYFPPWRHPWSSCCTPTRASCERRFSCLHSWAWHPQDLRQFEDCQKHRLCAEHSYSTLTKTAA